MILNKSFLLIIAAQLQSAQLWAEEGAAHGAEHAVHIPVATILFQILNLGILVALLTYFLRSKVKGYFQKRKADFHAAYVLAAKKKQEAEALKKEIQDRLSKLVASSANSLKQAETDAAKLKDELVAEAQQQSSRMRQDAEKTAQFEVERAKQKLKLSLIDQSVAFATTSIRGKLADTDLKRLNDEFVEKIQVLI